MKTKNVSGFSFPAVLLLITLLFGGLVPLLKVRYRSMREPFLNGDSYESISFKDIMEEFLQLTDPWMGLVFQGNKVERSYFTLWTERSGWKQSKMYQYGCEWVSLLGCGLHFREHFFYVPRNVTLLRIYQGSS